MFRWNIFKILESRRLVCYIKPFSDLQSKKDGVFCFNWHPLQISFSRYANFPNYVLQAVGDKKFIFDQFAKEKIRTVSIL
jgi:hypothetical protein